MTALWLIALVAARPLDVGALVETARSFVGTPYVYGGAGERGFDCSGLALTVFGRHGVTLPRAASDQARLGRRVALADLRAGDLLFFTNTPKSGRIEHVGVAIDRERMVHASTSRRRVVVDAVRSAYYRERLLFIKRLAPPAATGEGERKRRQAGAKGAAIH